MAILKQSKNMIVNVKNDYNLQVGKKLEKIASKLNVEAMKGNLVLASNKKIVSDGNKS
ncbi:hypothetical protein [Flavobacterium sp. H122]|uniref:hypothetical protein n=1 Tax=Flavobacterium sp. H122 TaxID=2529860 RepID=UPI00145B4565|nr:hypothetical protein [Flavobacterium sp. H122]